MCAAGAVGTEVVVPSFTSAVRLVLRPDVGQIAALEDALGLSYGTDPNVPTWAWSSVFLPEGIVTLGPHEPLGPWPVRIGVFAEDETTASTVVGFVLGVLAVFDVPWRHEEIVRRRPDAHGVGD